MVLFVNTSLIRGECLPKARPSQGKVRRVFRTETMKSPGTESDSSRAIAGKTCFSKRGLGSPMERSDAFSIFGFAGSFS